MKNILLVCNEGMSTSFLVKKMQDVAAAKDLQVKIWAIPEPAVEREWQQADVIMVGPQISYLVDTIKKRISNQLPVEAINPIDYGRINAEKVLHHALKLAEGLE